MSSFRERFERSRAELETLYMSLYGNEEKLAELERTIEKYSSERKADLKALDDEREKNTRWYLSPTMEGMTMYTELFAKTFNGIREKVGYLKSIHVSYLHLMPFMRMPAGENDGGFAVSDFMDTDPKFGTIEELEALADTLRSNGISLCMDFVMNHSADNHEWALKAKAGDEKYQAMYMCFPDRTIPDEYEKTVPEVFPETAPGSFIYSEEMGKWVLSSFYSYQWDLNYANPDVFAYIVESMMMWANKGVEVFRLDAVPYIWKKQGTSCRNLPEVHTLVRMIRIILGIAAPSVILKGEVVMAPKELAAYFGTPEKPECHLLYGVSRMVNIWGALSSMDTRLLYAEEEKILSLPSNCSFINYVRCHDDIGWGFDEDKEREIGIDPLLHKIFQYRFYCGDFPSSYARGELYNYDPKTQDARSCGTTASLVGLEEGEMLGSGEKIENAIARFRLIYGVIFALKGFPLINSGDEIGMLNDYSYRSDPEKRDDSRYVHRPRFDWNKEKRAMRKGTIEQRLTSIIKELWEKKSSSPLFSPDAEVYTWHAANTDRVFAIRRRIGNDVLLCVFSFSPEEEHPAFDYFEGFYSDLFTGRRVEPGRGFATRPYDMLWLRNER